MGSCSTSPKNKKTSSRISIIISDDLGLREDVVRLVIRLGCLISSAQKKYSQSIEVKNKSLAFEYMIKKLILEEKLSLLKEIIKKLQRFSGNLKIKFSQVDIDYIRNQIKAIESWLKLFKLNASLKENKLEDYIKQFDEVNISKQIENSINDFMFLERILKLEKRML